MTAFRASYFALFEEFFKDRRQDVRCSDAIASADVEG
jgi:hypothetical protein